MPFAEIFKGLLGGDPVKSIGDLIGQFHLSPEDKAKLQQATQELEVRRDEIEAARDEALAQIQSQNIPPKQRATTLTCAAPARLSSMSSSQRWPIPSSSRLP